MAAREPIMPGTVFGRWTVLREVRNTRILYGITARAYDMVLCRCNCGTVREVYYRSLLIGMSRSCGCTRDVFRRAHYVGSGMKRCTRCAKTLPLTAFPKRKDRGPKAVKGKCKSCTSECARLRRKNETRQQRLRRLARHKTWIANKKKLIALLDLEAELEENRKRLRANTKRWNDKDGNGAAKTKRYLTRKARALPAWADLDAIAKIYRRCSNLNRKRAGTGDWLVVDHIVPLQSELVCGLHVHNNLRIIRNVSNIRKGNRRWPDMPLDPPTPGKRMCVGCDQLLPIRKFERGRKKCRRCRYLDLVEFHATR